jgi:hypothetical protein
MSRRARRLRRCRPCGGTGKVTDTWDTDPCEHCGASGALPRRKRLRRARQVKADKRRVTQWLVRMGRALGTEWTPRLHMAVLGSRGHYDGACVEAAFTWSSYGRVRHKSTRS